MPILFYVLACICLTQCRIVVKDAGVATLTRGDVGMIFYVTLQNMGNYRYHVNVKMVKCCETFGEADMDCQLMNLMGGDMGLLHSNVTKNISLLYPNMYLHNRKGLCMISIKYTSDKNYSTYELRQKITFNTFILENRSKPILNGYFSENEYTKCTTIDQDPLDKCQPVNCHLKYLGFRNFFNTKWNRCQKVPVCISDPEKNLPDVSYLPISNKCRDLERLINLDDLRYLEKGIVEKSWETQSAPELSANLRCHHGALSNETGFCVCDDGWMSAPLDKDQYEPSLSIYHMCNIEISTWNGINSTKIKMTFLVVAVLGALFAMCTIMVSAACHIFYKCLKVRSPNASSQSDTGPIIEDSQADIGKAANLDKSSSLSLVKLVSSGSLRTAAVRNSLVIHRKSVEHRVSEPSLRIIERISKSIVSEESESEDNTFEKTEPFFPRRFSEMENDDQND